MSCDCIVSYVEGIGTEAHFDGPRGVAFYEGILYVTDSGNHVIRKIDADRRVTTLSGRGTPGFQNVGSGKTLSAMFYFPTGIIVTPKGLLLSAQPAPITAFGSSRHTRLSSHPVDCVCTTLHCTALNFCTVLLSRRLRQRASDC